MASVQGLLSIHWEVVVVVKFLLFGETTYLLGDMLASAVTFPEKRKWEQFDPTSCSQSGQFVRIAKRLRRIAHIRPNAIYIYIYIYALAWLGCSAQLGALLGSQSIKF